jgi:hypothetical protein
MLLQVVLPALLSALIIFQKKKGQKRKAAKAQPGPQQHGINEGPVRRQKPVRPHAHRKERRVAERVFRVYARVLGWLRTFAGLFCAFDFGKDAIAVCDFSTGLYLFTKAGNVRMVGTETDGERSPD